MLSILPEKLFSFSRYLNFCLDFSIMQKSDLIRMIRLSSKYMTPKPGKQTVAIHILPIISRSKGNQTMKFDQLIESNIRNIVLEKPYRNCGGETIPRSSSKKSKLSIFIHDRKAKANI